MQLEQREVHDLFRIAQSVLNDQFNHNKSELGRHVSLSQPTVNRTLREESDQKPHTRKRNLIKILRDLEENGYVLREGHHQYFVSDRGEEHRDAVAIPIASFKASEMDGNWVAETEELDQYIIDKTELGSGARAAIRKERLALVEVEGDSMMPDLRPGERVVVEIFNHSHNVKGDAVYLIRIENTIMLKALQRRPGKQLVIISYNDRYPDYTLDLDENPDFEVIGKVWGRFQRLG